MGTVYQFKTATDGIIDVVSQIAAGLITGAKLENNIELPAGSTVDGVTIATQDQIDIINQGMLPHAAVQTVITTATVVNFGGTDKGSWSTAGNYPSPNGALANAGKITLDNVSINSALGVGDTTTLAQFDRVLLRFTDAGDKKYSGLYFVQAVGVDESVDAVLYRALDFNSNPELVVGAYANVVGLDSPDLNNAYFLQSKGAGVLNDDDLTFVLWGTNTVTLSAGQGIDITSNVVSAVLAAGGPLSFGSGAIQLDIADPLYLDGTDHLALYAADGEGQAGYMSSADFNKLAAMGDSITSATGSTTGVLTYDFALPTQLDDKVAVYQIRLLAKDTENTGRFIVQTIEFSTACVSGVVVQLDSNPSGTLVTEYHNDEGFKNLSADFHSTGSGGAASLRVTGNGEDADYQVTIVRQVY